MKCSMALVNFIDCAGAAFDSTPTKCGIRWSAHRLMNLWSHIQCKYWRVYWNMRIMINVIFFSFLFPLMFTNTNYLISLLLCNGRRKKKKRKTKSTEDRFDYFEVSKKYHQIQLMCRHNSWPNIVPKLKTKRTIGCTSFERIANGDIFRHIPAHLPSNTPIFMVFTLGTFSPCIIYLLHHIFSLLCNIHFYWLKANTNPSSIIALITKINKITKSNE